AAGEVDQALAALDQLDADYEVDGVALKTAALTRAGALGLNAASNRILAESCLRVVDEAVAQEKWEPATKLLNMAEGAARRSQSVTLLKLVQTRTQDLHEFEKESEAARSAEKTLKDQPGDPQ